MTLGDATRALVVVLLAVLVVVVGPLLVAADIVGADISDEAGLGAGLVMALYGIVCALWAQNTERNASAWFLGGLIFGPLAGLLLLYSNSRDRRKELLAWAEEERARREGA
jgi:MFS family permease